MRYEDGQIAQLQSKATGQPVGLGQYVRQELPPKEEWGVTPGRKNNDHWLIAGNDERVWPNEVKVTRTYVAIPIDINKRTAEAIARRPSFQWLMVAQEALGEARDAEQAAGNTELSRGLNDLVLFLFGMALRED